MAKTKSVFYIDRVTEDAVYVVDLCEVMQVMSITNDAEAVVENLYQEFGNKKFIYLDTMGNWDELDHVNGVFVGFKPHRKN